MAGGLLSIFPIDKRPLEVFCVYFLICDLFLAAAQLPIHIEIDLPLRPMSFLLSVIKGLFYFTGILWDIFRTRYGKPLLSVIWILDRQYIICLFRQELKIKSIEFSLLFPQTPDVLFVIFFSLHISFKLKKLISFSVLSCISPSSLIMVYLSNALSSLIKNAQ
jgi:hypothetical protein